MKRFFAWTPHAECKRYSAKVRFKATTPRPRERTARWQFLSALASLGINRSAHRSNSQGSVGSSENCFSHRPRWGGISTLSTDAWPRISCGGKGNYLINDLHGFSRLDKKRHQELELARLRRRWQHEVLRIPTAIRALL